MFIALRRSCFGHHHHHETLSMAKKHKTVRKPQDHPQYRMGKMTDAPQKNQNPIKSEELEPNPQDLSPSDLSIFDDPHLNHDEYSGKILDEQQQILIRGIAHDINNNLMAILSACDEIKSRSSNSGDLDWAFNSIRMYVKSSAVLMRDLVNSHSSEVSEVMDQSQLRSFLKSILPSLSLVAGAETNIELGAVVTPPVQIHRMFLHRVLMQLIRNVSELDVDRPLAFISVRRVHQWCEISVADNGPGLKDLTPNSIFKPGVTTKGIHGTRGFGLSAVAWVVENWGGEYGVEAISNDNGCRFWIRIPLSDV